MYTHRVMKNSRATSVQSLSHVWLFATSWTAAHQASLSITNSRSLLKLMSIEFMSNHPILCRPLLLPPSIFPSIRVFSNESALCIRWPKYWSFSFNNSPSHEYSGLISIRATSLSEKPNCWTIWNSICVESKRFACTFACLDRIVLKDSVMEIVHVEWFLTMWRMLSWII